MSPENDRAKEAPKADRMSAPASNADSSWWWGPKQAKKASSSPNLSSSGGCPVQRDKASSSGSSGGCPVKHDASTDSRTADGPFALPASVEESARHEQVPQPGQRLPLSTHRLVSSIPRADEHVDEVPRHQPTEAPSNKWVYPSEQQFFNAMRRKGWQGIDESTIPFVVRIHNDVNEKGWREVRRWEYLLHGCDDPRLARFMGRPNDTSPKAWINSHLLFYQPPFDRHDWFVDRGDGKEPRRYVIDFYEGKGGSGGNSDVGLLARMRQTLSMTTVPSENPSESARLPSMYIDVRPALDSPEAAVDRVHMFLRESFPGIAWAMDKHRRSIDAAGESNKAVSPSIDKAERLPASSQR